MATEQLDEFLGTKEQPAWRRWVKWIAIAVGVILLVLLAFRLFGKAEAPGYATAPVRRGDLTVTEVCFEVGCSSLGTFSTRFTELVGVPPTVYREQSADATDGIPACLAKNITRPIRNREAQRG